MQDSTLFSYAPLHAHTNEESKGESKEESKGESYKLWLC
jgi:hypothetical protein